MQCNSRKTPHPKSLLYVGYCARDSELKGEREFLCEVRGHTQISCPTRCTNTYHIHICEGRRSDSRMTKVSIFFKEGMVTVLFNSKGRTRKMFLCSILLLTNHRIILMMAKIQYSVMSSLKQIVNLITAFQGWEESLHNIYKSHLKLQFH